MPYDEPMPGGGGKDPGPDGNDCERDDGGMALGIFILFEKEERPNPELGGGGWLGGPPGPTSENSLKLSRPGRNAISVCGGKPLLGPKPEPEWERGRRLKVSKLPFIVDSRGG